MSIIPSSSSKNSPMMSIRAFRYSRDFGFLALIILFLYGAGITPNFWAFLHVLGIMMSLALASFAVGGFIGFLFGIPHSAPSNMAAAAAVVAPANPNPGGAPAAGAFAGAPVATAQPAGQPKFKPSTNLEQIADWLTKIIIGVGLTQAYKIINKFNDLCLSMGYCLEAYTKTSHQAAPVIGATLLLFCILGFLIVYLWTYLYLIGIQESLVADIVDSINTQNDTNDKQAIDLANTQLNLPKNAPDMSPDILASAFSQASSNIISSIFFKTVTNRKQFWNSGDDKYKVDNTVPIFSALIKMDPAFEYPENYAELAYALKDGTFPDYAAALTNLNIAISKLTPGNHVINQAMLYFNRAICKIQLDPNFLNKVASTPDMKASIVSDLASAGQNGTVAAIIAGNAVVNDWKTINP